MAKYTPDINLYLPDRLDEDVEVDTSLAENFTILNNEIKSLKSEIESLKGEIAILKGES